MNSKLIEQKKKEQFSFFVKDFLPAWLAWVWYWYTNDWKFHSIF